MKTTDTCCTLLLCLLLTCLSGKAHALSCAQPVLDETTITNAVAVFEGVAGTKHNLTRQQKTSVKKDTPTGRFAGVENLSVYEFTVTKNWKGVATGQTVSILFNTTWGDNYLPDGNFLIVSPHCGGCDCGTPVSVVAAGKYKQQLQKFCAVTRLMENCEIVCETFVPACHEGLCW